MIDTLMVLWTKGLFTRFVRAFFTFLMLFVGICVMLFLVTASGVRLPGLAVTVAPPVQNSTSTGALPPATSHHVSFTVPIILQNPVVPKRAPAPTLLQTPGATYPIQRATRRPRLPTPTPMPAPTPTAISDTQS